MKRLIQITLISFCASSLFACADLNNESVGTMTGGILGGVLGSTIGHGSGTTVAIIGGTILGSFLGNQVGKSMDEVDKMKFNSALEKTPTSQTYTWHNPDNGNTYTVQPTRTTMQAGKACRNFTTTANMAGHYENINGRACRNKNGQWQIVS